MLGGRGTKRERKIPQRYQNSLDGGVEPSRQDSGAKKEVGLAYHRFCTTLNHRFDIIRRT